MSRRNLFAQKQGSSKTCFPSGPCLTSRKPTGEQKGNRALVTVSSWPIGSFILGLALTTGALPAAAGDGGVGGNGRSFGGNPVGAGGTGGTDGQNGVAGQDNPTYNGIRPVNDSAAGGGGGGSGGGSGGVGGSPDNGSGGQPGQNGTNGGVSGGGGGGGGNGGANGGTGGPTTVGSPVTGGVGQNGGNGAAGVGGASFGGGGGGGGAGGIGFLATGVSLTNNSTIAGGAGGAAGVGGNALQGTSTLGSGGGNGGAGGSGGTGISFTTADGTPLTLTNSGTIQGGNGGASGAGGTGSGSAASQNLTSVNGANGAQGLGGDGVSGSNLTIINSGSILGGLAAVGVTRANAITFTGGSNTLTLNPGWGLTGNISVTGSVTFNQSSAATLPNTITGTGSVIQAGAGTLTLAGNNTYSGGTTINAGTLAVSSDNNLGAPTAGITFGGGTLQLLRSWQSNRTITLNGGGGTIDTDGNQATWGGVISGVGGLSKAGAGTLTLTGNNTYSGGTTIAAGTLQLGSGGTTGSIIGDVSDNGTLVFDRSDTVTVGGVISGTGAVQQQASGTVILTGNNTYSGGTVIARGTLQLGNGGTTGSLSGNVNNGGTLAFDRSDTVTFGGTISGSGNLQQLGTGTTILTGNNTYTGNTTITAGTLQLGNGGTTGSISGLIRDGGTLAFDRSDAVTFANPIADESTGAVGTVQQIGTGTTTLTGFNAYSGGTTISAGTLAVSSDANLGAAAGGITFQGGTLQFLRSFESDRTVTLNGAGTVDTEANNVTLGGTIGGAGGLAKVGAGTLILTGNDTYAGSTTVTAGTLQLGNGGTTGSISGNISNGGTLSFDRSDVVTFGGTISDGGTPGAVQQIGTGTTILTGNNTYSGGTTINAGTLAVSADNNLGAATGGITFQGQNGTLQFQGSFESDRAVALNGLTGTVDTDGNIATLGGTISGVGGLSKIGAGTLILTGNDVYTGGTTISAGTLQLGNGGTAGAISGNVRDGGTLAFDRSDTVTFAGTISDAGSTPGAVQQSGTGTTVLTGNNTYSGGTTISAGTLQLGNGGTTGSISGNVSNGGTLAFDRSNAVTFSGTISDAGTPGAVQQLGTGTTVLTGNNTYTGGTTISAGTLQLGNGGTSGSIVGDVSNNGTLAFDRSDNVLNLGGVISGSGAVQQLGSGTTILTGNNTYTGGTTITAGTLQLGNGGTSGSIAGNVSNGGTLAFDRSDVATFAGTISDAGTPGAVQQVGTGTTILAGNNTYSGGTTINAGVLAVAADNNLGATTGGLTFGGGTLQFLGSFESDRTITLNSSGTVDTNGNADTLGGTISGAGGLSKVGAGTLILTGNDTYSGTTTVTAGTLQLGNGGTTGSISGNVSNGATLSFDHSDVETFAGTISDAGTAGSVQQVGTGTTVLTGTNTYSGGTTINAGTLAVAADSNLGAATGGITFGGGTLQILNPTTPFSSGRAVLLNAAGGTVDTNGNAATLSGVISGSGGFTKVGTGTLTLSGSNTYSGNTTISGGTLQIGNGATSGSILGNVANNGALAFDRPDAVGFGGVISGSGTLQQIGSGILTLSAANTYTGATNVQAGTLLVNGSLASSGVTVGKGATLGGTGTIANGVSIASGGILTPGVGTSPGTITLGSLNLSAGSILNYSLGTPNVVGGPTNDLTVVNGALTLAGTLNVANSGGFGAGTYRIINYGGALTNDTLGVGIIPTNYSGLIQTAIPGEVNLVVSSASSPVQFWDGTTLKGNGVIHGGAGVWNTSNTNWTTPDGTVNSGWQGGFGVFAGTAQAVTVTGTLSYQGLQFSSNGYQLIGRGVLTPTGQAPIRVDSGVTATVAVDIQGSGGLVKSDPGTLVLEGYNTYSGGTSVTGGTLQLTNGAAIGSGALTLNAGTRLDLNSCAILLTNAVHLSGDALVNVSAGDGAILSGSITDAPSAAGILEKTGSGELILTGSNTYSGGTLIDAGILGVTSNSALGTGAVTLSSGADLQAVALNLSLGNAITLNGSAIIDPGLLRTTLSGTVSGTGQLTKVDLGTLVLTGNNTYTGGTTVQLGSLQIGNGGTSGSISGAVSDYGRLAFDRSDAISFGGPISGYGIVEQDGTGTLTLTGTDTYTGPTAVNAGTLSVNGTLASAVTVNSGGTLEGIGSIGGLTVNSHGTLEPGNNSIGTLTVKGGLAFLPGSIYAVQVTPAGQSDLTAVSGKASLLGGTVDVLAGSGTYNTRTTYTILTATGGVAGHFSNVTSNLAFLTPSLSYNADDVFLTMTRNQTSFSAVAKNSTEASVGTALQEASERPVSTDGTALLTAVENLDAPGARTAFQGLSGEGVVASENVAFITSDMFLWSMHDQGQEWRAQGTTDDRGPRLWGNFFGSSVTFGDEANRGFAGQSDNFWGGSAGLDEQVSPNLLVGLGVGGNDGQFSVLERQTSGTMRGLHVGAYAVLNLDPWYIAADLANSHYNNETQRMVASFGGLSTEGEFGSFGSDVFRGRAELGRRFGAAATAEGFSITPYAALEVARLWNNDFSEHLGTGLTDPNLLGLNFESNQVTSLPASLGMKFEDVHHFANGLALDPSVDLAWVHEFRPTREMTAQLLSASTSSFTVQGAQPASNGVQVRAGARVLLSPRAVFYVNFEGEYSDNVHTYSGQTGVSVSW